MMDGADAPGSPPVPEVATRASVIARLDAMKAKDGPASNTEQSARSDGLAEFGIVTTPSSDGIATSMTAEPEESSNVRRTSDSVAEASSNESESETSSRALHWKDLWASAKAKAGAASVKFAEGAARAKENAAVAKVEAGKMASESAAEASKLAAAAADRAKEGSIKVWQTTKEGSVKAWVATSTAAQKASASAEGVLRTKAHASTLPSMRLHGSLVNQPGSRSLLNTPALVVSLAKLDRNINSMAAFAIAHDLRLRPHAKTHKCADIAKKQLAAGAVGVCCAKLGEAEALVDAGVATGLLLTSPVVGAPACARLAKLAWRCEGLTCVVDHPSMVEVLSAAMSAEAARHAHSFSFSSARRSTSKDKPSEEAAVAGLDSDDAKIDSPEEEVKSAVAEESSNEDDGTSGTACRLTVLVDVDPGSHRTGVASCEAAVSLAQCISAQSSTLAYGGVQFYCGPEQHVESLAARRDALKKKFEFLRKVLEALSEAGLAAQLVTGGGTGSHSIDAEIGLLTEIQPGSYVFMDRQYNDIEWAKAPALDQPEELAAAAAASSDPQPAPFETAMTVEARVVSRNHEGLATVDAGFKALSSEDGPPTVRSGAPKGSTYTFMGDEHGILTFPKDADPAECPALGDVVTFAAPHCDPTVNLYDAFHVVGGDSDEDQTLVAVWPIHARGRCQ